MQVDTDDAGRVHVRWPTSLPRRFHVDPFPHLDARTLASTSSHASTRAPRANVHDASMARMDVLPGVASMRHGTSPPEGATIRTSATGSFSPHAADRRMARTRAFVLRLASRVLELCCERLNPSLPICFLLLVSVLYGAWMTTAYPLLLVEGDAIDRAWHRWIAPGSVTFVLFAFVMACFVDPGVLVDGPRSKSSRTHAFDGLLYVPGRHCSTCQREKPARSKHCRACNRCVARFDHHCVWLNSCVGERNMRWFLLFLTSLVYLCAYGTWISGVLLQREVDKSQAVGWKETWSFILRWHSSVASIVLFLSMIGCVLVFFLAYQLSLVCRNLTTNESHKRQTIEQQLEVENKEILERRKFRNETGLANNEDLLIMPTHAYDRGLKNNLWEALFPDAPLTARTGGR